MKFTIETEPFNRLLEMLAQALPGRRGKFTPLRLDASRGRLRVQQAELVAEIEAVVWQDGRCTASASRLKEAVRNRLQEAALLIQLEDDGLRVGDYLLPCITDSPPVRAQASSRIFFASDLSVVPSPSVAALSAVG